MQVEMKKKEVIKKKFALIPRQCRVCKKMTTLESVWEFAHSWVCCRCAPTDQKAKEYCAIIIPGEVIKNEEPDPLPLAGHNIQEAPIKYIRS